MAKHFEIQLVGVDDRAKFRMRHKYPIVLLVDENSNDVEEAFRPGGPLAVLSNALHEVSYFFINVIYTLINFYFQYDNNPIQRAPMLLLGGFESWANHYPTLCTSKPPPSDFGGNMFGMGESYDKGKTIFLIC